MSMTLPILALHLDLKGVMFKPSYLPTLIDDLADQGINAILVEYETTFPFKGITASDDLATILTLRDIKKLNTRAKANNIQVIPVIQCLGHLEYILNRAKYKKFAIPHKFYDTIDPTNPKAVALVVDMLNQVIDAHPGITHIHLGMDEATSLTHLSKQLGRDVLDLFCDHLETLLKVVEARGIIPIIWADMIQDFYKPGLFDRFKGRVILSPWEYGSIGDTPHVAARLGGGTRIDKTWRAEPLNPKSPAISQHTKYLQDMAPHAAAAVAPYHIGDRLIQRHFYLDFFAAQGFSCLPGSAVRTSGNGPILLPYNQLLANQQSWAAAIKRVNAAAGGQQQKQTPVLGNLITSWARSRTFKPPNAFFDLTWPLIHEAARLMGASPKPFWPDIPQPVIDTLIKEIGRTREDWRIERELIAQMQSLLPKVKTHRYEWLTLIHMLQVLDATRRAEATLADILPVLNAPRLVPEDFARRLQELADAETLLSQTRKATLAHLTKRHHGIALAEWDRYVFDSLVTRLTQTKSGCRKAASKSRKFWA